MHIKCEQAKSGELAGEQFRQALRVTFWNIGDSDVLKIVRASWSVRSRVRRYGPGL